jgi:hypothetical protein
MRRDTALPNVTSISRRHLSAPETKSQNPRREAADRMANKREIQLLRPSLACLVIAGSPAAGRQTRNPVFCFSTRFARQPPKRGINTKDKYQ